jgi:DNA mismatch endonuclease, patch repair protein
VTDIFSKEVRSFIMSQIKGRDTNPEILVRKYLFAKGFRFRIHDKRLPGKPDLLLPKYKTIVFINGCFWHQHKKCPYFKMPKTRINYWEEKLNRNSANDDKHKRLLLAMGYNILTVWECELAKDKREKTLAHLYRTIKRFE